MKKNKSNKKKIILIFLGFLFLIAVIVLLSILLLFLQSKSFVKQEPVSKVETNNQQEQETYNAILNKIDKEVDKLTLLYPPKTIYQKDGITPKSYEIYDSKGKLLKDTYYKSDGKTIDHIAEHDKNTNIMIKSTYYKSDGKTIDYINEYTPTGIIIKRTYYNPDGTVKEEKNL